MTRAFLLPAVLAATLHAQEFRVPFRGIEETGTPNRYVYQERAIDEDRVFLSTRTTLSVETASGAVARFTAEPRNRLLMHVYAGTDRARWQTNLRRLRALSLGQLAPGITGELVPTTRALSVRLRVQAGADLSSVRFRLDSGAIPVTSRSFAGATPGIFWTAGEEFGSLYLPRVTSEAPGVPPPSIDVVTVEGGARFRLRPTFAGGGSQAPYTVTLALENLRIAGSVKIAGIDWAGQTWVTFEDTIARFDSTGALASLTVIAARSINQVLMSEAGPRIAAEAAPDSPIPPTAALPIVRGPADAFLVALDQEALLLDATHVGGDGYNPIRLTGTDSMGSTYFEGEGDAPVATTPNVPWRIPPAVGSGAFPFFGKWTPMRNRFDFLSYGPSKSYQSAPAAGGVVVSHAAEAAPVNTLTVVQLDSDGRSVSGGLLTLPLADAQGFESREPGPLAMSASGALWLTAMFRHANGGVGNALVQIGKDGREAWRVLRSVASPGVSYLLEADRVGNIHHYVNTRQNSLGSQRDSPYRGACVDRGVYYQRLTAAGGFLDGIYLTNSLAAVLTPRGTLAWFSYNGDFFDESVPRRETPDAATGPPAVACLVDHASRQPQSAAARGQLVTIIGQRLGPLDALAGNLVADLAGTRVLLDGEPVGLANVQAGLVTFRVPPDFRGTSAQLTVERDGLRSAPTTLPIADFARFGVFTTDGQGWGPAAFFGNPEPGGTVSFLATGFDQAQEAYLLIDERLVVKADFVGPTQHLLPGIQQINFRLPTNVRRGGLVTVSVSPQLPALPGRWPESRLTLPVR